MRVLTSTHDLGEESWSHHDLVGEPITTSRESEDQAADAVATREPLMSEVFLAGSSNVIIVG